ncbi:protein FAR1-RELATED SEQUENCE 6-like [Arachis ipaensis]|uniref:protein FAR1-RELATED SEQUENCE 6-like n=1 Tax=Arachis ipaensis TaxID=130454 RepID=UPI000A2B8FB6|nr:protein FAR1-RELATED SEQUENCE 6-like [Arachis ipaensis]
MDHYISFERPGSQLSNAARSMSFGLLYPKLCSFEGEEGKESEDAIQKKDDATVSNNKFPDHTGIPMGEIPYVGLRFDSLQRAQEFYSNYAKKVGFVTRIRNTNFDKTRKELKVPINQSIHYSHEGYRESRVNAATRVKRITTAGCKARMYVILDRQNDNWLVSKLELKHTHMCSAEQAVHYSEYMELTMHAKCVIQNNDEADVKEMISYFMRMRDINPNFFYAVDVDETNKFKSPLWVDARCRTLYEYFGDVVSFDTTYRRNKHGLPFASFVGVNHHDKSTLLGCALLGNEEIPSFEWVFKNWLNCMGNPPQAIITDQCKSMFGAIKNVFPNTRHRWCIWHIIKKIPHKLGGYAKYREINAKMHGTVWNARSEESFEKDWYVMLTFTTIVKCGFQYIFKVNFGLFVHEYDNVLGNKEQKELVDDAADSKGVVPCSSSSTIERQFQHEYTTSKFREVQHEFSKRGDCLVRGVTQEDDLFLVTVNEQYLLYGEPRSWKYNVEFDPKTHKVRCECNMFGSRDFVTYEEEAAMLHSGFDQLRSKLLDYRANLVSRRVPTTQNSTVTQCDHALVESDIQGPSKEVDQAVNQDIVGGSAGRTNDSQEHGGFLSLLNSFRPT